MSVHTRRTVVLANPSAELYGADLQLLETAAALLDAGWRAVVAVPADGPLVPRLEGLGATVARVPCPVVRRADLSLRGVAALARGSAPAVAGMRRWLRRVDPELVLVNTITLPWWLAAARAARIPAVCHVHEAEARDGVWTRRALAAPLALAHTVIVNSVVTREVTAASAPYLRGRLRLVHNGVRGPVAPPGPRPPGRPFRLLVVGRISPRKAPEVAIEATALLRASGRDVELELCGTPAPGHEDYFARLCHRADRPDLRGAVSFSGYRSPIWPVLERADVLVAPSLGESFGNAVVEGQLARRPVVASAVQGHLETVEDEVSGLLVPVGDPGALAATVARLMDEPGTAREVAFLGMRRAEASFGIRRYAEEVARVAEDVVGTTLATRPRARARVGRP